MKIILSNKNKDKCWKCHVYDVCDKIQQKINIVIVSFFMSFTYYTILQLIIIIILCSTLIIKNKYTILYVKT